MKKLLISSMLASMVAFSAQAESMTDIVNSCVDMEYYDDIMYHNSKIEILGYIEGPEGPYDRMGNIDIADVVKEGKNKYKAQFNVYENTVCVEKYNKNEKFKLYTDFNPWEEN